MSPAAQAIDRLYRTQCPPEFGEQTLRALCRSYRRSAKVMDRQFLEPEAHDVRGVYRRGLFEQNWRSRVERIPGVTAIVKTTGHNTSHYTELEVGRFIFTESCISSASAMPRDAEFRRTNARSAQIDWLRPDDEDAPVYGIVIHGEDPKDPSRSRPGFALIAFPDRDCDSWLHWIDLFDEYPNIMRSIQRIPIEPTTPLRLRPRTDQA